eukprot:CAMPEP_0197037336 /NCGR_PEP_ID=MMETSP1384-20130603/14573_1 /TAXON_ID=29189 /ORGANISM="Ammonia sp." /LENGTH=423 /DNA_ID=CAMNT_0042467623 /DNA_START=79 /DNA_END=1350 /DNA_ORIENTATION=-
MSEANTPSILTHESKEDQYHTPSAAKQLRFTSINSINRKIKHHENVLKYAQEQIESIRAKSNVFDFACKYEFNVFEFIKYTNRPLLVLGMYLLTNCKIFAKLFDEGRVELSCCAHFLDLCEKLYHANPYHNSIHATDVMQFNCILLCSQYIRSRFQDYELLAAFMSAVAHDIGHIGKNNDFLVKSKHELALKFDNVSCLEYYHIEQFHQTMTDNSRANWISKFDDKTQQYIIDLVEYAILGTDMGVYHNEIKKELKEKYSKQWVQQSSGRPLSSQEKQFIIRAMLHLSDISNPMRPFSICQRWTDRVNEEFFDQGDVMKQLGLEVSAGCDREKTDAIKNQGGFVMFCVKPLTALLHELIAELDWCLKNVDANTQKWNELKQAQEEEAQKQAEDALKADNDSPSTTQSNLSNLSTNSNEEQDEY